MSRVRLSDREARVLVTLGRLVGDSLTWRDLMRIQGRHIKPPAAKGDRMSIELPFPKDLADTGVVERRIQCGTDLQTALQALLWHERQDVFTDSERLLFRGMSETALKVAYMRHSRRAHEHA